MPKSAKGLRAYELSGLLFRRRCPCLHLKSPPNSSHAELGLQTPVKQVILHAGFHSPQKPKGDCDMIVLSGNGDSRYSSTHPKSRKAIVTIGAVPTILLESTLVPLTPKAERRL